MRVADLDEVTFDVEADGEEVRRTISRKAWDRRGWATVAALYEERTKSGDWATKLTIVRLQRAGEGWKKHAQVTLPGDQARGVMAMLESHRDALDGASDDD